MNHTNQTKENKKSSWLDGQAVVVGGSVSGLIAAQILSEVFRDVTVIDRDIKAGQSEFRPGVPQASHAHTLLPFGLRILEREFPGLTSELVAAGGVLFDEERDTLRFEGSRVESQSHGQQRNQIAASRPLLESILYKRVLSKSNVRFMGGMDALELQVDPEKRRVTGLRLRNRVNLHEMVVIPANLVIDASGRSSHTPQWLESLGYVPPEEWHIDSHAGYASRIFRQPPDFDASWKRMYINPLPPSGKRGGIILPLEGKRWHVTLIGIDCDYPPVDDNGFLAFAASLPVPDLFNAIQHAEPLTRTTGFRRAENRVRRYENLPAYIEGLLVTGDAVFTMNPVYALGMTAAAVSGQSLKRALQAWKSNAYLNGLAAHFQKQLHKDMLALWRQAVENEWRWESTEITDNLEEIGSKVIGTKVSHLMAV